MKSRKLIVEYKNEMEIPVKGSLGILAYGYRGVLAWREVRVKDFQKKQSNEAKTPK